MYLPSFGLNTKWGVLFIIIFASIFTIITYFRKNDTIKKQEETLSNSEKVKLYANRFIHNCSMIIMIGFPYIFKSETVKNFIFVLYFVIVKISWQIYKECPMSLHEKQLLDKKYIAGHDKIYEPYLILLFNTKSNTEVQNIIIAFLNINFCVVCYRLFLQISKS
jgi:hypothetical protein